MERLEYSRSVFFGSLIIGAALLAAGCTADLRPAPRAERVAGMEETARDTAGGVRMMVQTDEWPGPLDIKTEVTPVHVIVENNSGQPLRIGYDKFALVGPAGARFSALPPLKVEGEVTGPRTVWPYGSVGAPAYPWSEFYLAPYYGGIYPDVPTYWGDWNYDPYYFNTYYGYWRDYQLPTAAMLTRALPEGVLNPKGKLEGWLFFEKVENTPRVVFRADLANAKTGRGFGEIRTPFTVSY